MPLILTLFFLGGVGNLHAVEFESFSGSAADVDTSRVWDMEVMDSEWLLPENCHEEEVLNAGLMAVEDPENCKRIVCGPNYWGDSAIDICCDEEEITDGEGEFATTYTLCRMRSPKREYSNDPWHEVQMATGSSATICGQFAIPILESNPDLSTRTLLPFISPLFAAIPPEEVMIGRGAAPWTAGERQRIAEKLFFVAEAIPRARRGELSLPDFMQEWTQNPNIVPYLEMAQLVSAWGAHVLSNLGACPGPLAGLCEKIQATGLLTYWSDQMTCFGSHCAGGQARALNLVEAPLGTRLRLDSHAVLIGLTKVMAHEFTHVIHTWLDARWGLVFEETMVRLTPGGDRVNLYFIGAKADETGRMSLEDLAILYGDESGARIIERIVLGFLSLEDTSIRPRSLETLSENPSIGRRATLGGSCSMYGAKWKWYGLTQEQRNRWSNNLDTFYNAATAPASRFDPCQFIEQLETAYLSDGGYPRANVAGNERLDRNKTSYIRKITLGKRSRRGRRRW